MSRVGAVRRRGAEPFEAFPLCRPMREFDPSEPALVHDRRTNRLIPWEPAFRHSFARQARELEPGVVAYDGLLLDGWMILEEPWRSE
jgi:hypothetical protein